MKSRHQSQAAAGQTPVMRLWKVAKDTELEHWRATGLIKATDADKEDGVMHCSTDAMVATVINKLFRHSDCVIALELDSTAIGEVQYTAF